MGFAGTRARLVAWQADCGRCVPGAFLPFRVAVEKARIVRRTAVEITEVRIKLMEEPGERLQAFCSITLDDCFVVRDLKIIEGTTGPFVAMPSRKLTAHCPQCGCKNHLRAAHCNQCGARLREQPLVKDEDGRAKLYADIAHPINSICREMIQKRVIHAYQEERARAQMPGYVPPSFDDFDAGEEGLAETPVVETKRVSATEAPQIQPAEKPRGPHRPIPRTVGNTGRERQDSFGAGILE
jgi:stage V sporulation protein G